MPNHHGVIWDFYRSLRAADWERDDEEEQVNAEAWIEAETFLTAWAVVVRWFERMETDERVFDSYGYPPHPMMPTKVADQVVATLDEDFMLEKRRFGGRRPPEFSRLPDCARRQFAWEFLLALQVGGRSVEEEARSRLAGGETFPS